MITKFSSPIAMAPVRGVTSTLEDTEYTTVPVPVPFRLERMAIQEFVVLTSQPQSSVFGSPVFFGGSVYIGTSGPNNDDSHARGKARRFSKISISPVWATRFQRVDGALTVFVAGDLRCTLSTPRFSA